ncbi:MAG: hypothetical protein JWP94_1711 [Mucilaginibacter sp.]|nr:hypothetical protein [Mucilaginibacter sp.]
MKTIENDPLLDEELQELYILSKHRSSDIRFAEDEVRFLKKTLHTYTLSGENIRLLSKKAEFNKRLAEQDSNIYYLKIELVELLKFISPFINESNKELGINLLEKFIKLETDTKSVVESVKHIKKSLFFFFEELMKAESDKFPKNAS